MKWIYLIQSRGKGGYSTTRECPPPVDGLFEVKGKKYSLADLEGGSVRFSNKYLIRGACPEADYATYHESLRKKNIKYTDCAYARENNGYFTGKLKRNDKGQILAEFKHSKKTTQRHVRYQEGLDRTGYGDIITDSARFVENTTTVRRTYTRWVLVKDPNILPAELIFEWEAIAGGALRCTLEP